MMKSCKNHESSVSGRHVLAALSVFLLLSFSFSVGCAKAATPVGVWHNEELNQLLRFHEDGTVVVRTSLKDTEATWLYDKDGNQGVITLDGQAIAFTLSGDTLTLTWNDVQTAFVSGDMEIVSSSAQVSSSASSTSGVTVTPAPTVTPSPSSSYSSSLSLGDFSDLPFIPITIPTLAHTPTPGPSATSSASISRIVIPGNIFGDLINPLMGTWYYTEDDSTILIFDGDGVYTVYQGTSGYADNYTYDSSTGKGMMEVTIFFTTNTTYFNVSGNMLYWDYGGGYTFIRK